MFVTIIIRWLYICMVSSATINRSIRQISDVLFGRNDGPCFVRNSDRQINSRSLKESLKDLKSRAQGLQYEAENFQNFLAQRNSFSIRTRQYLKQIHWIKDIENLSVSEEIANLDSSKLEEAFKLHYNLLYILGVYIKEEKSSKIVSISSEEVTVERLNEYEKFHYQLMCSLQSTIQATGNDVTNGVNTDILHPIFIQVLSGGSLYSVYIAIYITLQDSVALVDYLSKFYDVMYKKIVSNN